MNILSYDPAVDTIHKQNNKRTYIKSQIPLKEMIKKCHVIGNSQIYDELIDSFYGSPIIVNDIPIGVVTDVDKENDVVSITLWVKLEPELTKEGVSITLSAINIAL